MMLARLQHSKSKDEGRVARHDKLLTRRPPKSYSNKYGTIDGFAVAIGSSFLQMQPPPFWPEKCASEPKAFHCVGFMLLPPCLALPQEPRFAWSATECIHGMLTPTVLSGKSLTLGETCLAYGVQRRLLWRRACALAFLLPYLNYQSASFYLSQPEST